MPTTPPPLSPPVPTCVIRVLVTVAVLLFVALIVQGRSARSRGPTP